MAGQDGDPRHHTQKMAKQLQDTITHLREDVKKVDEPQLKAMFEKARARDENTQVIVQADEATHHGRVVGVMELAKQAGLRRLAIATRRGR